MNLELLSGGCGLWVPLGLDGSLQLQNGDWARQSRATRKAARGSWGIPSQHGVLPAYHVGAGRMCVCV
jgi:hypothetical protein